MLLLFVFSVLKIFLYKGFFAVFIVVKLPKKCVIFKYFNRINFREILYRKNMQNHRSTRNF